jgi:hypothetical protein
MPIVNVTRNRDIKSLSQHTRDQCLNVASTNIRKASNSTKNKVGTTWIEPK